MYNLRAGLKNELLLMLYRRKTLFFFILAAAIPIVLALTFHALQPMLGLVAASSSYPIQMLNLYTIFIIPLFLFLTIADLFPQEISARTLKIVLLRPIHRVSVYTAKILALGISIAAVLLILAVVTSACNAFLGSQELGTINWFSYGKAYIAAFFSMWALSAVFVFVAQFFRSASGFLVFSILLYAAAKVTPFFLKGFSSFSLASYTDWYMLWLSHSVSAGKLITSSLFVTSGLILFFTLGYILFDRKEA